MIPLRLPQLLPALTSLNLWDKTSGTWINIATVILGTWLGLLLKHKLPRSRQRIMTQGLGLLTLFLGMTMAGNLLKVQAGYVDGMIVGLLALILGGVLGDWWQIETRLAQMGDWLKQRFQGNSQFTDGFVAASLLFCVGPMTILGSLNNGLTGDRTLLTIKAAMDGCAAIALASSYGIGTGFSSIAILLYQGGLSLAAGLLTQVFPNPTQSPEVFSISGVGGLIIVGIGLNLLEIVPIKVSAFLPALPLAPLIYTIAQSWR